MQEPARYFLKKFEEIEANRNLKTRGRRIGSELKFPLVKRDGSAPNVTMTNALWEFLIQKGWEPLIDPHSGQTVGATTQGEMNEHRASCETGFCKVEFSLAHTDNLHALHATIEEIRKLMREFSKEFGAVFLGFGLQPLTPPGKHLLMKKSRNLFWDTLFGGNAHIPPEEGTDVHLFTISASNQVHIDVTMDEAVDAINVFNGLAGAQVALTANSNIWKGRVEEDYKCLGEVFWDWWLEDAHPTRYGVPERKFLDLEDYFRYILEFPPVYVRRDKVPVGLPHCPTFSDFYSCGVDDVRCELGTETERLCGLTADGEAAEVAREESDLDQHFTFFWHNARLSRYYTLENRVNDQQPPDEMMAIPALTLGVMENLDGAASLIGEYQWEVLRESRMEAIRKGMDAEAGGVPVARVSESMVNIALEGLKKRGLAEEVFLEPLKKRLEERCCPADKAARIFNEEGLTGLLEKRGIGS